MGLFDSWKRGIDKALGRKEEEGQPVRICPKCFKASLKFGNGKLICLNCGYEEAIQIVKK